MLPDRLSKLLTAYVDGELTSRQRRTVVRLLQRSPEARRLFKKLKGDSMILRGLPRRKLQMDLSGSVLLTIAARNIQLRPEACPPLPPKRQQQPWKKWLALAGVAAAILLAVGVGSYLFFASYNGGDASHVETPSTSSQHVPEGPESALPESPIAVVHDVDPMLTTPPPPPSPDRPRRPPQELAGILTPKPQPYQVAEPRLVRILQMRNLDQPIPSHQLQEELKAANALRFDLFSSNPAQGLDRLQAALKAKGIQIRVEPAAQSNLQRGLRVNYAVYSQDLTAGDVFQVLNQLAAEEKQRSLFDRLVVNDLQSAEVARTLGGDPTLYPSPPARQGPLGIDLTKPIPDKTGDEIVRSLSGQPSDRQAIAVNYTPLPPESVRYPVITADVRSYLDSRPVRYREGAVQVLLVVWNLQ